MSVTPWGRGSSGGRGRRSPVEVGWAPLPPRRSSPRREPSHGLGHHVREWGVPPPPSPPPPPHTRNFPRDSRDTAGSGRGGAGRPGWGARSTPGPPERPPAGLPAGGRRGAGRAGGGLALPGPSDSRCLPQLPIQIKLIKPPIQH